MRAVVGRFAALLVLAALVMPTPGASAQVPAEVQGLSQAFDELRSRFSASPAFTGSWIDDPEREKVMKALEDKRVQDFLPLSAAWLDKTPVDGRVHLARASALSEAGDSAAAAHHRFMFYGLLESILASGDGRSRATAYRVISVDEEYTLINFLGAAVTKQRLEGTVDVVDLTLKGTPLTLYFDVSRSLSARERTLRSKP